MMDHRLRRLPIIEAASDQRLVLIRKTIMTMTSFLNAVVQTSFFLFYPLSC